MSRPQQWAGESAPVGGPARPVNPRWIIRLPPGVDLKSIRSAEELMDEKMQEIVEVDYDNDELVVFDRLPDHYIVALPGLWPASCNLRCLSCTLTFQGKPWFIPVDFKNIQVPDPCSGQMVSTPAFKRRGVTCSPNCAVTFIETYYDVEKQAQFKELLVHLHHAMTGQRVVHIEKAPSHLELRSYHGSLSDDEFWEKMKRLAQKTKLSTRKFDMSWDSRELSTEKGTDGWGAAETLVTPPLRVGRKQDAPEAFPKLGAGQRETNLVNVLLATKHRYPLFAAAEAENPFSDAIPIDDVVAGGEEQSGAAAAPPPAGGLTLDQLLGSFGT